MSCCSLSDHLLCTSYKTCRRCIVYKTVGVSPIDPANLLLWMHCSRSKVCHSIQASDISTSNFPQRTQNNPNGSILLLSPPLPAFSHTRTHAQSFLAVHTSEASQPVCPLCIPIIRIIRSTHLIRATVLVYSKNLDLRATVHLERGVQLYDQHPACSPPSRIDMARWSECSIAISVRSTTHFLFFSSSLCRHNPSNSTIFRFGSATRFSAPPTVLYRSPASAVYQFERHQRGVLTACHCSACGKHGTAPNSYGSRIDRIPCAAVAPTASPHRRCLHTTDS